VIAAEMRKWLMTPAAGRITLPDEREGNQASGAHHAAPGDP
jgi:hypothetical protein